MRIMKTIMKNIEATKLRSGIILGFDIGAYQYFDPDLKNIFDDIYSAIKNACQDDGLSLDSENFDFIVKRILSFYAAKDLEKMTAVLIGMCCKQLSIFKSLKNKTKYNELISSAKSFISEIDASIVFDRNALFDILFSLSDYTITHICEKLQEQCFDNIVELQPKSHEKFIINNNSIINNTNTNNNIVKINLEVSLNSVIKKIQESTLDEEDKTILKNMMVEIEEERKFAKNNINAKNSIVDKVKSVFKWLANKAIDTGMALTLIPFLTNALL